jgi:hypothetical protein
MEVMQVPDLFGIPFLTECKVGYSYGTFMDLDKFKKEQEAKLLPERV